MENVVLATSSDGTIVYQKLTLRYLKQASLVTRQTLFKTGTVCRTLGVPQDPDALSELDQLPLEAAKDGISIIAVDKTTDKVAGVAINKLLVKSQPFFQNFLHIFKNFKSRQIIEFILSTDNICDIFEHCGVDCVMEILFLGTSEEYRKKGIAKKLCELSVEVAQKLRDGVDVKEAVDGGELGLGPVPEAVYAMFTSFISQKIGRELGFEIAARRSMKRLEIMGEVVESSQVETPVTTVEYKLLHKS
ncbi:uncharacterized protein LOC135130873 [Zophobas morio]|uniref:uncharacterized protein LOC135130873 n=1 Tax=Zophobas morio TaxID=2755281 RepID=UPI0030830B48